MATQQPPPPRRPKKIRPLPKEVVDRIAAGEVVQRPVSVVKELIENSLDADGTQIDVQTQRGGLDSITVTDNGTGISPRDLPLACTRFATSKLVDVDDLKSIRTFGFRGEALASASMVARVGITSRVRPRNKTAASANSNNNNDNKGDAEGESSEDDTPQQHNCAFKMNYKDGSPDPKTNPSNKPKPSAGREGTVIQVQDLFYNIPSRRRALDGRRSEREEYDKILSVIQRYAVHEAKRGVGFLCRGSGTSGGAGGGGKKGGMGKKKGGFGGGGNHTDLNTQSLGSVKKLQERRKRARLSAMSTTAQQQQPQQQPTEEEQFAATKDVIGHIFGAAVTRELLPLTASEGDVESVSLAALKAMVQTKENGSLSAVDVADDAKDNNGQEQADKDGSESNGQSLLEDMMMGATDESPNKSKDSTQSEATKSTTQSSKFAFAYRATGLITNGSYSAPKSSSAFLLFINDRLVESSSIRRSIESVYSDTLPKGGKPFIYLALELPGPHLDVNVHPTKREVAFLHEDRLCDAVSRAVRSVIGSATTSRTFSVANGGRLLPKETEKKSGESMRSKLVRKQAAMKKDAVIEEASRAGKENMVNMDEDDNEKLAELPKDGPSSSSADGGADVGADEAIKSSLDENAKSDSKTPKKRAAAADDNKTTSTAKKRAYDPSRLVRTNRALPVGALEPYLVQKEASSAKKAGSSGESSKQTNEAATSTTTVQHKPGCPLAGYNPSGQQVDMSMPGAFASAICRCQVERAESLPPAPNNVIIVRNNINNMVRPKKITPTQCDYESIVDLREEVMNLNHQTTNEMLRGSTYVGAVSRSRSLIQCGIDLLMINHREMARAMFYQIALMKFGGMPMAKLGGGGVDVMAAISQMLQFEEDLNSSSKDASLDASSVVKVSKTNADLARQATTCLAGQAPMLEEYFSVKLEKVPVYNNMLKKQVTSIRVTGLPILLEGHSPQPHGLPLFLLRLATEVEWAEEQPCFKGICTELASFYSELPFATSNNQDEDDTHGVDDNPDFVDDEAKQYIKHALFPAISFLLVPPETMADGGAVVKLANLNSLYKVFERC